MGNDSGVASSSSLYIFIVLSHSPVSSLIPLLSNSEVNMPFSAAIEPGYGFDVIL